MKETDVPNDPELQKMLDNLAQRIRSERKKAKLSQMELALMADLSINHVYAIETGHRFPNMSTFFKISKALNIDPSRFFKPPPDEEKLQDKDTIYYLLEKYL